jgi:predicted DNA-binding protein
VIRERLEEFAAGLDLLEEAEDLRLVEEIEHRLAEGQERSYSHEEVWSEIDDLESRGELPD